jgi:hypothetical protein
MGPSPTRIPPSLPHVDDTSLLTYLSALTNPHAFPIFGSLRPPFEAYVPLTHTNWNLTPLISAWVLFLTSLLTHHTRITPTSRPSLTSFPSTSYFPSRGLHVPLASRSFGVSIFNWCGGASPPTLCFVSTHTRPLGECVQHTQPTLLHSHAFPHVFLS